MTPLYHWWPLKSLILVTLGANSGSCLVLVAYTRPGSSRASLSLRGHGLFSDSLSIGHSKFVPLRPRCLVLLSYDGQMDWYRTGFIKCVSLVYIRVLVGCNNKISPQMLVGLERAKSSCKTRENWTVSRRRVGEHRNLIWDRNSSVISRPQPISLKRWITLLQALNGWFN